MSALAVSQVPAQDEHTFGLDPKKHEWKSKAHECYSVKLAHQCYQKVDRGAAPVGVVLEHTIHGH